MQLETFQPSVRLLAVALVPIVLVAQGKTVSVESTSTVFAKYAIDAWLRCRRASAARRCWPGRAAWPTSSTTSDLAGTIF
jgi:hypothetical protein